MVDIDKDLLPICKKEWVRGRAYPLARLSTLFLTHARALVNYHPRSGETCPKSPGTNIESDGQLLELTGLLLKGNAC